MKLRINAGETSFVVALDETPTAKALGEVLPFESVAQTWGEEVYFEAPLSAELEPDARQVVEPGTACFWVEGSSVALPFGRTPISGKDGKPKLAARCNVLGRIVGDPRVLAKVKSGERIRMEAV
ncbi:MAG TPA: cyclophilin-like fold protein [Burkholderiales bacterium]|nr:cyclophilin-like fold protein [Burkholderiales bacterium]